MGSSQDHLRCWFTCGIIAIALIYSIAACSPSNPDNESAQTILKRTVDKARGIKSLRITREYSGEMKGALSEDWQLPDRMRQTGSLDGVTIEKIIIGGKQYQRNSLVGSPRPTQWEVVVLRKPGGPFAFLEEFKQVERLPDAFLGEEECFVLVLREPVQPQSISNSTEQATVWIDRQDYLPRRAEIKGYWGKQAVQALTFADFDAEISILPPN